MKLNLYDRRYQNMACLPIDAGVDLFSLARFYDRIRPVYGWEFVEEGKQTRAYNRFLEGLAGALAHQCSQTVAIALDDFKARSARCANLPGKSKKNKRLYGQLCKDLQSRWRRLNDYLT